MVAMYVVSLLMTKPEAVISVSMYTFWPQQASTAWSGLINMH